MKARDTHRYELRDGRKIVGFGISDDPERRAEEHSRDRKRFTSMNVVGPAVTRESAETWEEKRLEAYRKGHSGRNPRYNKTDR